MRRFLHLLACAPFTVASAAPKPTVHGARTLKPSIAVPTGRRPAARPPLPKPMAQSAVLVRLPETRTIDARVLAVQRQVFPEVKLRMVDWPGAHTGTPKPWDTYTRFARKSNGEAEISTRGEIEKAAAWHLLAGDHVRATVRKFGSGWALLTFERVPAVAPTQTAALRVELSTDHEEYELGEDVRLSLTLENTGRAPALFRFKSGQRYEFVVRKQGREIWRWSLSRAFTQAESQVSLAPGETLGFHEIWTGVDNMNSPAPPGEYTVAGWATADGATTESSAEILLRDAQANAPTIDGLVESPKKHLNKEITLIGRYRAQLAERGEPLVDGGPPTSRRDWILQDDTGSIYVAGTGSVVFDSQPDLNRKVQVQGLVRMSPDGRIYIRAFDVKRLSR